MRITFRKAVWIAVLVLAFPAYVIVGGITGIWNGWMFWGMDLHLASKT